MTRFIQQSACEGRRPHGVVPDRLRSRPRLLSRLLEDRGALRLVVAPPGFGKATLAFEYASVMFQFEHVFWLRGSSPCFLRDLDAGVLAEAVLEADEHAALMVVADLPLLTDDRAEAFAEVVERLADASCEVIATTTRADAPMELFGRRVVIEAAEMLVAREDLEEEPEGVTDRRPLGLAERIAALRWGSARPIQLVLGASRAGCTPEEELALWAMTVLGRGTIDDVRALLGARRAEKAWDALAARCPLVGISAGEESFAALSVSLGEVRDHGRARLQALAETCGFAGREEAIEVLAERLMERGECGRAVSAMTLLARRRAHGRWLAANGWAALWGGAAVEVCELYDSATRTQMGARADINAMIAWAWAQRGDRARAVQFAQRSLVSERSTPRTVLSAALAAWEVGNAATRRAMEETVASCLAELDGAGGVEREDGLAELVVVAHGVLALGRGDDVLAVWASRVGEALDWGSGSRIDVERGWSLGFGAYRAAAALERAGEVLEGLGLPRLSAPVAAALFAAHVEKGAARSRREKSSGAPVVEDSERGRSLPVPSAPRTAMAVAPEVSVEPLRLKLFGTMEVALGRRDITYQFEGRPKTRLLLALLALHRGRELGRDQIVSMLWPAADKRTGAKSFYRVWGDLRSLLSQQGSCPYLIRSRYGCRLDPDLFESDLDEFEELIRCLLFGPADDMAWERAIATIQGSFGSVLLPTERKCEAIVVFRDRLDAEFVDGLVAASRRLLVRGELQGALWLAREAFQRDAGREDAAAALMRAQMATDQRSAAVQTFFACRDRLSRTLGLDPSPALAALYRQLLEGELSFA
ncbi:MAG: BTAD domain-containing putative transcriptional regulator [Adlercreutzia equolifaciens]